MTHRSVYADTGPVPPLFAPPPIARATDPATSHAAAREVTASGRRGTQCAAILAALRAGPRTNAELSAISIKYTGRLSDLRKAGCTIRANPMGDGVWLYRLTAEPQTGGGE